MPKKDRVTSKVLKEEDLQYDLKLRPVRFEDFIGQQKMKDKLKIFIQAAKQRKESLDHVLFFGSPGLGKTTLAHIIAREMGASIKTSSGPVLERPGDLAGLLTNLESGGILFIDEIHRLPHIVEEYLYPAMEDYTLNIIIDKGPHARSVKLELPRFTLIGATTRSGLLTSPLRSRFGVINRLDYYPTEDLRKIVHRSSRILQIEIDDEGASEIARRARGTPRVANRLLRRVRDYAQVRADNKIAKDVADEALKMLEIDEKGLDDMDRRIIECIIYQFNGGPVGISTLAISVGEEQETIEEVYEPYLIRLGFIKRTSGGRVATEYAHQYFKSQKTTPQRELW